MFENGDHVKVVKVGMLWPDLIGHTGYVDDVVVPKNHPDEVTVWVKFNFDRARYPFAPDCLLNVNG